MGGIVKILFEKECAVMKKIKVHYIQITFAFALSFYLGIIHLQAQNDFGTGLILDDEKFEKEVVLKPATLEEGRRASDLPRWFSLRPYSPFPKHQGKINSCVGWAMGYGAMTIQTAYKNQLTDRKKITKDAFSALFIYNQIKMGSCLSGAYIHDGAQLLVASGNCKSESFDYPYHECDRNPKPKVLESSKENIIQDYVALFNKNTTSKTKVIRTKRSIAEGKPVIIGLKVFQSLKKLNHKSHIWKPNEFQNDKELGGHALVVVGYNDSLGVFEIMNSWGSKWGDQGFFFLSYRDFAERVFQGLQLIFKDDTVTEEQRNYLVNDLKKAKRQKKILEQKIKEKENKNIAPTTQLVSSNKESPEKRLTNINKKIKTIDNSLAQLKGRFKIQLLKTDEWGTPLKDKNNNFTFEPLAVSHTENFYALNKKDWEEGDMFQLVAEDIRTNSYLYVFSLDANNKAEVHFPRLEKNESPLISDLESTIVLPSADRVLVKENLKEDHICVLYSKTKIENFERLVQDIQQKDGKLQERLQGVLGEKLAKTDDIQWKQDNVECNLPLDAKGEIIALIIKIEGKE